MPNIRPNSPVRFVGVPFLYRADWSPNLFLTRTGYWFIVISTYYADIPRPMADVYACSG